MATTDALPGDLFDDEAREVIAGLFDPGERVRRVATTRLEGLSDNGIVRVLKFAAAEIAQLEAMQVRDAAVLARRRRDRTDTAAEVALALCLTDSFAGAFVSAAESLTTRLPQTFALMERGQLNLFRAMKVTDATDWLPDDAARTADAVLAPRLRPKPGQAGKNATQVRKAAAYAAQQADPEGAKRRTDQAREDRKFTLTHQESGTATLSLDDAPVEKAIAAYGRVNRMAKTLKTKDEPRSKDQLRADVALDLLLSADGGGAEPRIEGLLYLSLDTYLGLNENPGQLAGHGPIPASLAREILAGPDTVLRRILTDPRTGHVLDVGRTRYRPTAAIRDFVQIRDQTCRRPGCCRPAHACDLDHTLDWQYGGPTSVANLAGFRDRDHGLKDRPGWHFHTTHTGTIHITTPAGMTYRSEPPALHDPHPDPDEIEDDDEDDTPPF